MRVLVLLAALVAAASASRLVGQNKCTYGPSYWCDHIKNAKECGALQHCIGVWKSNVQPTPKSTESCLICKGLIRDVKLLVDAKATQDKIQSLALQACALLHNEKTAQEVCDTVVTMFLPEIIKMLEADLDENLICSKIGLCSSQKLQKLIPVVKHVAKKLKTQECDECKLGVSFLKNYLTQNATVQEIVTFLTTDVCPRLPGALGTMCKTFVAKSIPQLLAQLNSLLDPTKVCSLIGMCPKTITNRAFIKELIVKMRPKNLKANPIECDLCEAGITDIRVELRQPNTQKEVITFLKSEVCPHLGSLQVTCSQAVDQYIPVVFQLLVSELDPTTICTGLGLCGNSTVKATKILSINKAKPIVSYAMPKASVTCVVCEFVMTKLDQLLGQNRSEEAIEKALEDVCSLLPSTIRSECDGFVQQYTPLVVRLLAQYVNPAVICKAIGLCAGETEPLLFEKNKMFSNCDLMMRYLRVLVKGTRMGMDHSLDIVCNFVPRPNRKSCRVAVTHYRVKALSLGEAGIRSANFHTRNFCRNTQQARKFRQPDGLVHLLGTTECTQGPQMWCANVKSAAKCGALQYCMQHVWNSGKGHL